MKKTSINARKFIGYSPFPYLTGRRLFLLVGVYVVVTALVFGIVKAGHWVLLQEVRARARELASLVAMHVDAAAHETVQSAEDMARPEYQAMGNFFKSVAETHPDIEFIYTMRPVGARDWVYVVNVKPDGEGNPGKGHVPGEPVSRVDAAMKSALVAPTAEGTFYRGSSGKVISGYAPIVNSETGETIGILGVDIPQRIIQEKVLLVNVAGVVALAVLMFLGTVALGSLFQKAEALKLITQLDEEIQERNKQLARSVEILTDRERIMQHDLMIAQELQQRYLPEEFPANDRTRCAAAYRAASVIGGDLYNVIELSPRVLAFFIADVSGHGISAALITTLLKVSTDRFRRILDEAVDSSGVSEPSFQQAVETFMRRLNDSIAETTHTGRFITFSLNLLDLETGEVLLANAGHQPPLVWTKESGAVSEMMVPANLPLGLVPQNDFAVATKQIGRGDKLIVYTDGLVERRNAAGSEFGVMRFIELINTKGSNSPKDLVDIIMAENEKFAGDTPADDDRALLVVEYL